MEHKIQPYLNDVIDDVVNLSLPVADEDGNVVGNLRPITKKDGENNLIIHNLTTWRNQNMGCFLTQFHATEERTKKWLKNVVFKKSGQMLFMLYSSDELIGHVGFKDLTNESAMLDNAIRGQRMGHPKLFVYAHLALADWLFSFAKIDRLIGYVLADNAPALMMNRQIGWTIWTKYSLEKEENNGEIQLKLGAENELSSIEKYCYKIEMVNHKKTNE